MAIEAGVVGFPGDCEPPPEFLLDLLRSKRQIFLADYAAHDHAALIEQPGPVQGLLIHRSPPRPCHLRLENGILQVFDAGIYVVLNGPPSTRLPDALKEYHVYPRTRFDEVIQRIRTEFEPLTDHDREVLAGAYKEINVSADQLSQSAKLLRELTARFNRKPKRHLSGDRLLSELLRLRKKGILPRIRP
jgi:hypothetical protein